MLFASFLNFSITSRALLAIIVPLNLFITYNQGPERAMNFSQMTVSLVSTVIGMFRIRNLLSIKDLVSVNKIQMSFVLIIAVATIHQLYAIFSPESESRPYLDNNSRTNKLKDKSRASQTQSAENSRNIFSRIVQYLSSKLIYSEFYFKNF